MKRDTLGKIWGYVYTRLSVKTPEGVKEVGFMQGDFRKDYLSFEQLFEKPEGVFPVLYPPEMLVKEIPVGSIQYTPLQAMASMCYKPGTKIWDYSVLDDKEGFYAFRIGNTIFGYDAEARAFLCIDESKRRTCCIPVKCQWDMFYLMFLLKVDFMGLIKRGEALSVFDMPVNPYK